MVINLDESQIRTLEQMRAVLDGTHTPEFTTSENAQARCEWIEHVLAVLSRPSALQRQRPG